MKKVIGEPQFRAKAELKVESARSESGKDAIRISFPRADGNPDSRVYAYEVAVVGGKGTRKLYNASVVAWVVWGGSLCPNASGIDFDVSAAAFVV